MKKVFFLIVLVSSLLFSQEKNPLVKQEVFPISNPGFEQQHAGWNIKPTEKKEPLPDIVFSFENIAYEGQYSFAITLNKRTS
ncbi:MAG: hypothetical protein NC906_00210, partial [Candidatus Omnitrophica bacterium]|nr:hypothetical protein [Candidatus Omnitrophota bacterium]